MNFVPLLFSWSPSWKIQTTKSSSGSRPWPPNQLRGRMLIAVYHIPGSHTDESPLPHSDHVPGSRKTQMTTRPSRESYGASARETKLVRLNHMKLVGLITIIWSWLTDVFKVRVTNDGDYGQVMIDLAMNCIRSKGKKKSSLPQGAQTGLQRIIQDERLSIMQVSGGYQNSIIWVLCRHQSKVHVVSSPGLRVPGLLLFRLPHWAIIVHLQNEAGSCCIGKLATRASARELSNSILATLTDSSEVAQAHAVGGEAARQVISARFHVESLSTWICTN